MKNSLKLPMIYRYFTFFSFLLVGFFAEFSLLSFSDAQEIKVNLPFRGSSFFPIFQGNTILALANPDNFFYKPPPQRLWVIVTAYSSTPEQTDDDPYITAAGTQVREGIVANNFLPFGTKIKIPELFGEQVFVVEDRMHWRKGDYLVDVWFSDNLDALNFGAKETYIEILND